MAADDTLHAYTYVYMCVLISYLFFTFDSLHNCSKRVLQWTGRGNSQSLMAWF